MIKEVEVDKMVYREVVKIVEVETKEEEVPWASFPSVVSWNVSGRIPAPRNEKKVSLTKILLDLLTDRKSFEMERTAFTETRKVRNTRNLRSRSRGVGRFVARSEHASYDLNC